MSIQLRIRQKYKFAATTFLMLFSANGISVAQKTTALMDVTIKVVSVPEFKTNFITDISNDIHESDGIKLGNYQIKFPDEQSYSISFDPNIELKGKKHIQNLKTKVQQKFDKDGRVQMELIGEKINSTVLPDLYSGQFITTIHYD